jgi:hypothetical protein
MTQLPTNRTSANTVAEHVADHNTLATEHNELDGHAAATTTVHGITDTSTLVTTSDSRLSDTRTPTDGSVTNAKVASNAAIAKTKLAALAIVNSDVDAAAAIAESKLSLASDAAAATASRRTLGTGATQACAGTDSRLSDARTPTAHKSSHATGGSDALAASDIGAANIDGAGTGSVAAAHSGDTATASSTQAVAIGKNASANTGAEAIAIGGGVSATAAPQSTGQGGIAIGASNGTAVNGARAAGATSVAIGSGDASFAGASAANVGAVAVGLQASCSGNYGATIGSFAAASATQATAVGASAVASSTYATALGTTATATTGNGAVAIGGGINTTAAPNATAQGAIAIGAANQSGVNGSRASATSAIAIGSGDASVAGASASAADAVAIGRTASAAHSNATAIGQGVSTTATNQVNIGTKRLHQGVPNSAPADADLVASQASLWLDESGDVLSFKAKRAAGTVLSGGLSPTTHAHSGTYEPVATAHHARHDAGGADAMTIDAVAATGSLRTLGDAATQAAQGSKRGRILDEVHADAGVASSAAEQTLATLVLPAVIAVGDTVRFVAFGDSINSSGSAVTYTWKFKIGGTTVLTSAAISVNSNALRPKWRVDADIVFATTSAERVSGLMTFGGAAATNWGAFSAGASLVGYGTAAEDTASPLNVILTCQLGTSVSTADVVLHGAYLELIKK